MADSLLDIGSYQIFPLNIDWNQAPKDNMVVTRYLREFPGTSSEIETLNQETPIITEGFVSVFNKADESTLLSFLHTHKGKINKFWLKYPSNSFNLSRDALTGAASIYVTNNSFDLVFQGYERIYFLLSNGDIVTRHISAVTVASDEIQIDLTSVLDRDIAMTDVVLLARLLLVRFDQDEFSFDYETDRIFGISLRFVELVKEYSEI